MKIKRLRFGYRANASSLHRKVGDTIRNSPIFKSYNIYQEYPVIRINPVFYSSRPKFDWVILELKVVIECHGAQHYSPVTFGHTPLGKSAEQCFKDIQHRDAMKKEAALKAGFTYTVVPYTDQDKITEEYILSLIETNKNTYTPKAPDDPRINKFRTQYQAKKKREEESGYAQQRRQQAREYRKKLYERSREQRKHKPGGNGVEGK